MSIQGRSHQLLWEQQRKGQRQEQLRRRQQPNAQLLPRPQRGPASLPKRQGDPLCKTFLAREAKIATAIGFSHLEGGHPPSPLLKLHLGQDLQEGQGPLTNELPPSFQSVGQPLTKIGAADHYLRAILRGTPRNAKSNFPARTGKCSNQAQTDSMRLFWMEVKEAKSSSHKWFLHLQEVLPVWPSVTGSS